MKATAIYFTNSSKKSKRTGKIPIYLRVCFKGSKSECRLNAEISEKEVSKWDPMTMRIMERNSPINHYLNRLDQKFGDFIILHSNDISTYTALAIKNYVMGINATDKMTAMKFVDDYFNNAVLNNVDRTQGTIKNYRRSINHFRNFLKSCQKQDLLLENLNFEIAADFKNYLVNSNTVLNRVGMTEVSAAGVIKKFRTIFTDAADKDLLKRNPFKLVKIKTKSPRRERLSIEQIEKIYFLDTTNWQYLPIYRDIFLFSVYTGLAYHDAMSLTADNIESRKDGSFKLTVRRGKTDVITECFLPDQAIEILKKYEGRQEIEVLNTVLPYRSNKEVNVQLKKLAELCGISMRLSTHIARHSYRQLLAEAGIYDMGVVKRLMGQSRNGDVDEVYYSVTDGGLLKAKEKLQRLLNYYLIK